MRNHAERNGIKHICLPKLECGPDNLQRQVVHKILHETLQGSPVNKNVCFPPKPVAPISEIKYWRNRKIQSENKHKKTQILTNLTEIFQEILTPLDNRKTHEMEISYKWRSRTDF